MRIDMTICLKGHRDYTNLRVGPFNSELDIQLTPDQAKALRDQITRHLRGAKRDGANPEDTP